MGKFIGSEVINYLTMKKTLEMTIEKKKDLKLYFYLQDMPGASEPRCDYFIGYSQSELINKLKAKALPIIGIPQKWSILLEVPIKEVLAEVEIPAKLSRKSFINNINYTKDFLVKDSKHKLLLEEVLTSL